MKNETETSLGIGLNWVQNQYSIKTFLNVSVLQSGSIPIFAVNILDENFMLCKLSTFFMIPLHNRQYLDGRFHIYFV